MKKSKILIAVFAVMTAVSAAKAEGVNIDFDGKKGAPMFAQLLAQAGNSAAAVEAGKLIPARAKPVFKAAQIYGMNKSIDKAISHAGLNMKKPALKASLECLRDNASQEEKFLFVYAAPGAAYKFPEACSAKRAKGWLDDALQWVCEAVWVPVCKQTCSLGVEDGETIVSCIEDCNDQLVESCSWL
ncbi:MAG: hypothetical protein Q8O90_09155 [Elusimicrobiota bacterium]|nr:hypothetical protein [Elusimicrobiota bacterium]